MITYPIEKIEEAKQLYIQGFSIRKIAEKLKIPAHCTVDIWKKKHEWKKSLPTYPINSLKAQLERVTALVDKLEPEIAKVDILKPSAEDKEMLTNFKRFSDLQLKLIKQLSLIIPIDEKPDKSNIFM